MAIFGVKLWISLLNSTKEWTFYHSYANVAIVWGPMLNPSDKRILGSFTPSWSRGLPPPGSAGNGGFGGGDGWCNPWLICLEWEIVVVVWGILWFMVVDIMGNCNPCSPRNINREMLFHLSAFHSIWDGVAKECGFGWIDDLWCGFWCIDWRQHVNEYGWLWMNTRHYHATYRGFSWGDAQTKATSWCGLKFISVHPCGNPIKNNRFFSAKKISRKTSWNPLLTISSWFVGKFIHFCTCLLDIEISPRIYVPFSKMAMEHFPFEFD